MLPGLNIRGRSVHPPASSVMRFLKRFAENPAASAGSSRATATRGGAHFSRAATKLVLLTRLFGSDWSAAAIERGILGTGLPVPGAEEKQEAQLIDAFCSSPSGL